MPGLRPATLLKKSLWHRCFPMNFAKFLGTPFLQNTFGRLLLYLFWLKTLKNLTSQKISKWEIQQLLALSMQINQQTMILRLGHYAIRNQGKVSAALVRTIVFNVCGSRIRLIKKKLTVVVWQWFLCKKSKRGILLGE